MQTEEIAAEILRQGLDDWVPLKSIHGMARLAGVRSESEIKRLIVEALAALLDQDLIRLGNVTQDGFTPWAETASESAERVRTLLNTTDALQWEFAAWARNTEAGVRQAEGAAGGGDE